MPFTASDWGTVLGEYDATNGVTDAGGGAVSSWAQKSGSTAVAVTQSSAGLRPTTGVRTSPTGLNVLDCDGGDVLFANPADEAQVVTLVAVAKWDTLGGTNHDVIGHQNAAPFGPIIYTNAPNQWRMYAGTELGGPAADTTNWHVFVAIFNGASSQLWVDGVQVATGDAGTESLKVYSLGGSTTGSGVAPGNGFDGGLAHAIYYDNAVANVPGLSAALTAQWITGAGDDVVGAAVTPQFRRSSAIDLTRDVGQRAETVVWEVLDADLNPTGQVIAPYKEDVVSIRNDTTADVMRTVDNFTISEADASQLNMLSTRIKARWLMDDGTSWPLGVFMFSASDNHKRNPASGSWRQTSLYDQGALLTDRRREAYGLWPFTDLRNAIIGLLGEVGISLVDVGGAGGTNGEACAWEAGTPRLTIIRHLCALAGLMRPFFDSSGVCVVRNHTDLATADPDHVYTTGPGGTIMSDSIVESLDLYDAPNCYVVMGTGPNESEVSATAYVPGDMPHSVANTGREKTEVIKLQGIVSSGQARLAADAHAAQRDGDFHWYEFQAAPNPRHDTFQIVNVDNVNYREVRWDLMCKPGGTHTHSLREAYTLVEDPQDSQPDAVGSITP